VQYVVCAECGYITTVQKMETCPNCSPTNGSLQKLRFTLVSIPRIVEMGREMPERANDCFVYGVQPWR
jgi:hypothetical protein